MIDSSSINSVRFPLIVSRQRSRSRSSIQSSTMVNVMKYFSFLVMIILVVATAMVSAGASIRCRDDSLYCDTLAAAGKCDDPNAYGYVCDDGNAYCYCN